MWELFALVIFPDRRQIPQPTACTGRPVPLHDDTGVRRWGGACFWLWGGGLFMMGWGSDPSAAVIAKCLSLSASVAVLVFFVRHGLYIVFYIRYRSTVRNIKVGVVILKPVFNSHPIFLIFSCGKWKWVKWSWISSAVGSIRNRFVCHTWF